MENNKKEDTNRIGTENATKPSLKGLSPKDKVLIQRGKNYFEVPLRELMVMDIHSFLCKKCGHIWLPRDRTFNTIPSHCPKCQDRYWFLSKTQAKKIMKERSHTSYSIEKAQQGLPKEKTKTIKKEVKEKW